MGFRVEDSGFGVEGLCSAYLGCKGLGFRVEAQGIRV